MRLAREAAQAIEAFFPPPTQRTGEHPTDADGFSVLPPVNVRQVMIHRCTDIIYCTRNVVAMLKAEPANGAPLPYHLLCENLLHSQRNVSIALGMLVRAGKVDVTYEKRNMRNGREVEDMSLRWIGGGAC